eukprot:2815086-Prymnesium_polylepis.1
MAYWKVRAPREWARGPKAGRPQPSHDHSFARTLHTLFRSHPPHSFARTLHTLSLAPSTYRSLLPPVVRPSPRGCRTATGDVRLVAPQRAAGRARLCARRPSLHQGA